MTQFKTSKRDVSADLFAALSSGDAVNTNAAPNVENSASGDFKNAYEEASQPSSFRRQPVQARPETLPPAQASENPSPNRVEISARIAPSENIPLVQVTHTEKEQSVSFKKPSRVRDYSKTPSRCMTASDVATYLKVSVSTVWRLLNKDPHFPEPTAIGGSTRWDQQELDLYLDGKFDAVKLAN